MRATLIPQLASSALLCSTMAAAAAAQSATAPAQAKPQETTIVGCLVRQSPASVPGGRQGDIAGANPNDYFVRTPTVAVPPGATVLVGKPGTTSTATSSGIPAADSVYRVTGLAPDHLKPHLGHRVELKGTLTGESETTTTAKTTVDAIGRATTTTETRPTVAGVLQATAIKMLAASCE
jgi:hypothetical protein